MQGKWGNAIAIGLVGLMLTATQANASGVVKWVDDEGVVHFSEPHLAQAPATKVTIQPANGMDRATAPHLNRNNRSSFTIIKKPGKKNKDGWNGKRDNNLKRSRQRQYSR